MTKIDHILGHKRNLKNIKLIESIQKLFSDHHATIPEQRANS